VSYCINPNCNQRQNPDYAETCLYCGTSLIIHDRIRLIKPIRVLSEDPFAYHTEVFEIDDSGTQWHKKDNWQRQRIMKVLTWNRPELLSLFQREAEALRRIKHPRIPWSTIDDYFTFTPTTCPELHCLAMQKIEGQNLHEWILSYGKISQSQALRWLRQLFEILDYVHSAGYFHRDIKPSNIIVQPDGQLALIDFGGVREVTGTFLSKLRGGGKTDTIRNYAVTGVRTPNFSPLEQFNGVAVPQSDFFAVGRTFVYCLTGTDLTNLKSEPKTGRLIWRNKAAQIDSILANFLDELMAPYPGDRPQTTQIILHRLKSLPLRSKLGRLVRSKPFIISAALLGIATSFGLFKLGTSVMSLYYFDLAYRNQDRPKLAKKYYESAIYWNPKDSIAYNNLASICQQLHDDECVRNSYKSFFKLNPNDWVGYYGLGNFYDDQGKYDLAQQQYEIAIQKGGNDAILAINNLARLKNKVGKYTDAIQLATQGLKLAKDPDDQAALYKNLGWAKFKLKNYNEAIVNLHKATDLDPQRADAYCLLAQSLDAIGNHSDAQSYWEVCLIVKSDLPEVQSWRQIILQKIFNSK
jgi:serine/threonine protein kinase/cytochrome c-type biogenesis protein CcmH/NrfG